MNARPRRSDALRNIDAILSVASRLLSEQPRASMQDVAAAAGVHRATVHRHFPSRDDLLAALRRRALDDVQTLLDEAAQADGDPRQVLQQLTRDALRMGDRTRSWRILPAYDDASEERAEQLGGPLVAVLQRAQESGAVRGDLSPLVLASAWGGLVISALPLIAKGTMGVDDGADYVCRVLSAP